MPRTSEFIESEWGAKYVGKVAVSRTEEYKKDYNKFYFELKKKEDPDYVKKISAYQKTEENRDLRAARSRKKYAENREKKVEGGWVDKRTRRKRIFPLVSKPTDCGCGGHYTNVSNRNVHLKSKKHLKWFNEQLIKLPPPPLFADEPPVYEHNIVSR